MQPLNWSEIYVVSSKRRLPTAEELVALRQTCGVLPDGYEEFVSKFGFGELDGIHILLPEHVASTTSHLRRCLRESACLCDEFEEPFVIPRESIDDGIPLAVTNWGDHYLCSPSDPGVLWYVWHGWDYSPAILPLGFRNPFVHQVPGDEPETFGPETYVFDPHRDAFSRLCYVRGPRVSSDVSPTLEALTATVHNHFEPTRIFTYEQGTTAFLHAWGAEIRVGYRQSDSRFFLFIKADAEHADDCEALLASVAREGYDFVDSH